LQNQVFRLRRALPAIEITSASEGYCLASASVDVDADVLAAGLHAGEVDAAALDAVLARWNGSAYPELADVDDGRIEASRLDELRVLVVEARAEHRLASGAGAELVPELARLVDEHPLRERPTSLLMEALVSAGRSVEALRTYDDFRRRIGDELGIEPSPALAAQHGALLQGTDSAVTLAPVATGPAVVTTGRLPVPATRLIGRDRLVDDVVQAMADHRVVTLVGPGGVGKTRVAVELGHRSRADGDRPVTLCELNATAPAAVVEQVAADLGIEPRAGTDLVERIADVLGSDPLVLVLDGCEHALDPVAALVERLVARCPEVRVLVTSQERLRVSGESVLRVPSLPSGDEEAAAVQLFVERARAAAPGIEIPTRDLELVADITRRLDGLPLAIELAAARLHTHELAEVAAGLDERFSLLSAGYRSSTRHGSLRAAVSWSYDLLDARSQQLLAELSVFAGSFSAGDAAAVSALDPPAGPDDLAVLVERSLVARADGRRYALLETLRAFGAEQLESAGSADAVRRRHAEHHVAKAEDADRRLIEPPSSALADIDAALPELRSALGWLLSQGDVELAGRLMAALLDYGIMRLRPDVLAWAEQVVAADPDDRSPLAALVWVAASYGAWMAGDIEGCGVCADRARAVAERSNEPEPPEVGSICGSFALFEGRLDDAVRWYRRGIAAATAVGDVAQLHLLENVELLGLAYAGDPTAADLATERLAERGAVENVHSAYLWYCAGEAVLATDPELARTRYVRALELAQRTGAPFVTGVAGASKVSIDARTGDPVAAAADYRRLIAHWRRAGVWSTQWTMLRSIAGLLARLGRPRDAAVLVGAVWATESGHRIFGADEIALGELGDHLRAELGEQALQAALEAGAALDGDAAIAHALHALG
jgi:predicted ATPase